MGHVTTAIEYLPAEQKPRHRRSISRLKGIGLFVSACLEGLATMHRYDALRARGISHAAAVAQAFDEAQSDNPAQS